MDSAHSLGGIIKRILVLLVVSATLVAGGTGAADASAVAPAVTPRPTRIMLVGDSVTQGKVGDFTWRYRLWQTLQRAGKYVDFVGPHTGLFATDTRTYENPGYADPDFDQDHAAWWGLALADIDTPMNLHDTLIAYRPDIVIDDLGFNDLVWAAESPEQVIDRQRQFVTDVRAADPGVTVILGQLSQTWKKNRSGDPIVNEYNDLLVDLATSLDQPRARVIAAVRPNEYVEGVDTYDPAHPTASGEIKLAQQFADVLATLPLADRPPAPPTAPATYSGAAVVSVVALRRAARLTFTTPLGATRQSVWKRDVSADGRWRLVTSVPAEAHRLRVDGLRGHHTYAFRVRSISGRLTSTTYSNRVRVRVG